MISQPCRRLIFQIFLVALLFLSPTQATSSHHQAQCYTSNGPFALQQIQIIPRDFVKSPSHHSPPQQHFSSFEQPQIALIYDYLALLKEISSNAQSLGPFWCPSESLKVSCQWIPTSSDQNEYSCTMMFNSESITLQPSLIKILKLGKTDETEGEEGKNQKRLTSTYDILSGDSKHSLWCVDIPPMSVFTSSSDILYDIKFIPEKAKLTVSDFVNHYSTMSMLTLLIISSVALFFVRSSGGTHQYLKYIIASVCSLSTSKNFFALLIEFSGNSIFIIGLLSLIQTCLSTFILNYICKIIIIGPTSNISTKSHRQLSYISQMIIGNYSVLALYLTVYSFSDPFSYYCLGLSSPLDSSPLWVFILILGGCLSFGVLWLIRCLLLETDTMTTDKVRLIILGVLLSYPVLFLTLSTSWCLCTWLRDIPAVVSSYATDDKFTICGVILNDFCYSMVVLGVVMVWGKYGCTLETYQAVGQTSNSVEMDAFAELGQKINGNSLDTSSIKKQVGLDV